jgi:acetolactate synthase-1/2/3 large subunit
MNKPVIMLGHGVRLAGCADLVENLSDKKIPILTSWQAKDLISHDHPAYFGSPGVYGQRAANKILYEADTVIAIGNRLCVWNIGYTGLREGQDLMMVDCDESEVSKFPKARHVGSDIRNFMLSFHQESSPQWWDFCNKERLWENNVIGKPISNGYLNSYHVMAEIQKHLRSDEIILADIGSAQVLANQVLKLSPPQRLMSSGGLGEMGMALPAAVGASFAKDKGDVLCLLNDGGLMMNLQELQTIVTHKLPVKMIVFSNDGYAMIRRSQKIMGMPVNSVGSDNGLKMPSFKSLALALGIAACECKTWPELKTALGDLFASDEAGLVEVFVDPDQTFLKLNPVMVDGKPQSPKFCDLEPRFS